jgi:hypothetical protein
MSDANTAAARAWEAAASNHPGELVILYQTVCNYRNTETEGRER